MERIAILDFGGQYNQLIARRVREAGVFSELLPHNASLERIRGEALSGIIFTGGPDSVYEENAKTCLDGVFSLGVPILGICYGMQYIAKLYGGDIGASPIKEYGKTPIYMAGHPLLKGLDAGYVWMNHNDSVTKMPAGFASIAHTENCPFAAFANDEKRLYGIQFHAEVAHTPKGELIFKNFLKDICRCACDYSPGALSDTLIDDIRAQVGSGRVLGGVNGGILYTKTKIVEKRKIDKKNT